MSTLLALAVVAAAATAQAEPRNVLLRRAQQEADSLVGQVRWSPPLGRGGSAVEGYEWRVADDTVTLTGKVVVATDRAAAFAVPFPCGDTINLRSRVRAVGTWDSVSAWGESEPQSFFRACANLPPGAPVVELVMDTAVVLPPDTTAPPPPPVDPGGAFFVEDFETGDLSNTMGGFSWSGRSTPVRCGEQAFSGNCARRFGYRGVPDGEDGMAEQRFDIGVANKSTELWIEYQLYVPDNLVRRVSTGPNNDKFFFLWDENTYQTKRLHMEFLTLPGGSTGAATFSMKWADTQHSGISAWALRAPGFLAVDMRGTWVRIRYHAALGVGGGTTVQGSGSATRGQDGTGVFQLWVNDDLLIDVSTLSFDPIGIADPGFQKGYIFGWSNSGYDEDTIWYVDDFKVYKVQPGWN